MSILGDAVAWISSIYGPCDHYDCAAFPMICLERSLTYRLSGRRWETS